MCRLCDRGFPQDHSGSRRNFLKTAAATGVAASALDLLMAGQAAAHDDDREPEDSGSHGRRYVIRGGAVMSMDPKVGDFPQADVLVEGKKIVAVGPQPACRRRRGDRRARPHRDARLHRHAPPPVRDGAAQLPGRRHPDQRRLEHARAAPDLLRIHPADVRSGVPPAGRLHQRAVRLAEPARRRRDDGARHLADPPLAAALRRRDPGAASTRGGAPCSAISRALARDHRQQPGNKYPDDAARIKKQWFSSTDQLVTMIMGGEIYLAGLREGLEDRARARPAGGGAHPVAVRHAPDARPAGAEQGRRQRHLASGPTTCSST